MSDLVTIELVNGKIWAQIPFWDGNGPRIAKGIPGARPKYDKPASPGAKRKFLAWVYPANMEICRTFREKFGTSLAVGVDLAAWARTEMAQEASQLALRSARDADLIRVPSEAPALAEAMSNRKYQRVGARFIADGRNVIIADEPGTGKTLCMLGGLVEVGSKTILVFAKKKAVETVWVPEIPRWLGKDVGVYAMTGTTANRERVIQQFRKDVAHEPERMRILIGNIEMCRAVKTEHPCYSCTPEKMVKCPMRRKHKSTESMKFADLFEVEWDAIIVDESHKALIGKNTMSNSITQTRLGFMRLKLAVDGIKIAASGTPMRGKVENFWGTLNWLRPDIFTSYWTWVGMFFKIDEGYGGSKIINGIDPAKKAAFDRMLAPYMLRRTKEEVAPDMPPRQYGGTPLDPTDPHSTVGVWLDMEPSQAKRYRQIADQGSLKFANGEIFINGVLAEITRRKQFAICDWEVVQKTIKGVTVDVLVPKDVHKSNKYQWLLEFAQERAEAGLKVLVASQFTKVVEAFSAQLRADGVEVYTLTGKTSDKAATASVAAFNDPADPVPVFFINTMAGGESINLDACADDVIFIDETSIPEDQEQVENRIHRMSRIHQVNVWYLRSRKSIEEAICRTTGAREMISKGRLDGSRGIEAYRRLLEDDGATKAFKKARKEAAA